MIQYRTGNSATRDRSPSLTRHLRGVRRGPEVGHIVIEWDKSDFCLDINFKFITILNGNVSKSSKKYIFKSLILGPFSANLALFGAKSGTACDIPVNSGLDRCQGCQGGPKVGQIG